MLLMRARRPTFYILANSIGKDSSLWLLCLHTPQGVDTPLLLVQNQRDGHLKSLVLISTNTTVRVHATDCVHECTFSWGLNS